jgi:formamidopyrimidine-DNA glycosylase
MPELPEVQSFANALDAQYAGKRLARIVFHRPDLRFPFPRLSLERIFRPGARFESASRVGKQLLLTTNVGAVRVSLGMSGAFFPASAHERRKHEHVTLHFDDGAALGFEDPRRFGFWVVEDGHAAPSEVGFAAAVQLSHDAADGTDSEGLRCVFLSSKVTGSRRSVKDVLMDQRLVAGVGNIYALEALFRVGVHPATPCTRVPRVKWESLALEVPKLLETAIAHGGSSISTYRRLHGDEGGFQTLHLVYGREGAPCLAPKCHGVVVRIVQGGRGSFFCPSCQRLRR